MSVTYAVGVGHDVADENLNTLVPQPHIPTVMPGRTIYSAGGDPYQDIHHVEFRWAVLEDDAAYRNLLVQFGLSNAETAEVTVRARDDSWNEWRVNGTAYRPIMGRDITWRDFFPRRLVILVRDLEEIS